MRASLTALRSPGTGDARRESPVPGSDSESGFEELRAELIEAGESLVSALDAEGAGPEAAFWLWFRDVEGWRLVLEGGRLTRYGPRIAKSRIRRLLDESDHFEPLATTHIGVPRQGARVVQVLRSALRTGPGMHGVRIHDNILNGVRVQRAYIYRIV